MEREDDQQLWDLMDSASPPEVSPFFARNVLRRVREEAAGSGGPARWLGWRRLLPFSAVGAATAAILVVYGSSFRPLPLAGDDLIAKIDSRDYEVVADLDNLLASDENNLWDDTSSL